MKRFVSFLCFIILASTFVFAQQNTVKPNDYNIFYYENGNKSSEGMMRNGKPDDYWKTYYENGVLKSEGNRKNFLLDSTWNFYNENGDIILQLNYKKGKKNGIRRTIQEDEILEENFVNDVKQGVSKIYYPGQALKKSIPFTNGLEDGLAKEYAREDGRVISLIEYKKGFVVSREKINRKDKNGLKQGKWKFFHPNGSVMLEGIYRNDKKNGFFKEYDKDGNLVIVEKYLDGLLQENVAELAELEVRTEYFPSGRVKIIATYKDDKAEGVRREYNEDGSIARAYIFEKGIMRGEGIMDEDGSKEGDWKEYFLNGNLRAQGKYKDNKRIGEWVFYHINGNVEQKGSYNDNGHPDAYWQWFYADGMPLREENYYNGVLDGDVIEYSEEGDTVMFGSYLEGKEEGYWIYKVGDSREEGKYFEGRRQGEWKVFYADNSLKFIGSYIDGNPNGKHYFYWPEGLVKLEGKYVMGIKQGKWIRYNRDGSILIVIDYKNGVEVKYDGIKVNPPLEDSGPGIE